MSIWFEEFMHTPQPCLFFSTYTGPYHNATSTAIETNNDALFKCKPFEKRLYLSEQFRSNLFHLRQQLFSSITPVHMVGTPIYFITAMSFSWFYSFGHLNMTRCSSQTKVFSKFLPWYGVGWIWWLVLHKTSAFCDGSSGGANCTVI